MIRKATAAWQGGLKQGEGNLTVESGLFREAPYNFGMRFEKLKGTNPEELIGAAHAGCFSMQLSAELEKAGFTADKIQTQASVNVEKSDIGWTITGVLLDVTARVPGMEAEAFQAAAEAAKAGCPVSRALKAGITLQARLESTARA